MAGEHGGMRRDDALAASRHDEGHLALDLLRTGSRVARDDLAKTAVRKRTGEVVYPSITLRLGDDADDVLGAQSLREPLLEPRHVVGPRHRKLERGAVPSHLAIGS